jgi:penicillin G amidase
VLLAWDNILSSNSPAATLYEVWLREIRRSLAQRAVPENLSSVLGELPLPVVLLWLENPQRGPFTGKTGENAVAARDKLLADTLKAAWRELSRLQGDDPNSWSWGKLHLVHFRHPLDRLPGGAAFNLGPVERPGDGFTVNATGTGSKSFEQTGGASFREIMDLNDWDQSLAINTPGQSGVPGDKHYSDLLPLWTEGKYFPLLFSREAVEKSKEKHLVLQPPNTK